MDASPLACFVLPAGAGGAQRGDAAPLAAGEPPTVYGGVIVALTQATLRVWAPSRSTSSAAGTGFVVSVNPPGWASL